MTPANKALLTRAAIYAAIGVTVYLVLKNFPKLAGDVIAGAIKPLTDVGGKIGSGIYDIVHPPREQMGEELFYTPTFPDGVRHAVGSMSVSPVDSTFTLPRFYGNQVFQLRDDRVTKLRIAVPVKR